MSELSKKKCQACREGASPLEGDELVKLANELGNEWKVINDKHLEKEFRFKNFSEALDFTNKLAKIAEEEDHHPDIHLSWGKVRVLIWTHKINGLTESDFILAAKFDSLFLKP